MNRHCLLSIFVIFFCFKISWSQDTADFLQQGDSLYETAAYTEAILLFERAITTEKDSIVNNADCYYKISKCYERLKDYPQAIATLKKAMKCLPESDKEQGRYWNNTAYYLNRLGQYKAAIQAYEKAITIKKRHQLPTAKYYTSAAQLYDIIGEYAKSIAYYTTAIEDYQKDGDNSKAAQYLSNRGGMHRKLGQYEKALSDYKLSIRLFLNLPEKNLRIVNSYAGMGNTYDNLQDYPKAIEFYKKGLKLLEGKGYDWITAMTLNNIGDSYRNAKEWEAAGKYLKESLALKLQEEEQDTFSIASSYNNIGGWYYDIKDYEQAILHQEKAINLLLLNPVKSGEKIPSTALQQVNDRPNMAIYLADLAKSWRTLYEQSKSPSDLEKAYQTYQNADGLVQIMLDEVTEESQLIWVEKTRSIYEAAIETSLLLYKISEDKKYTEQAFNFAERNKAVVLYRALQKNNAKAYQAPTDLLTKLQKRLKPDELLIEYFIGKSNIYTFWITPSDIGVISTNEPNKILPKIQQIHRFIKQPNQSKVSYDNYLKNAYAIYKTLMQPILTQPTYKRLIILPDAALNAIPFAALLTEEKSFNETVYNLPYLIQQHQITYGYSVAMLLNNMNNKNQQNTNKAFVGYSPTFPSAAFNLQPIGKTQEGMVQIKERFDGAAYIDNVPLHLFYETYTKNDILYFATHAEMDTLNSDLGRIYFSDSTLTTQQIYQLILDNELVVLGACESGSGLIIAGEGVMSLSRAFMYAGSPSVVSSLWQVNEQTTNNLLSQFFDYLTQQKSKDTALYLAQKNYLDQGLNTHPYYWAAFTHVGDWTVIKQATNSRLIWGILGSLLLGLLFSWWIFKKKAKK